MQPAAAIHDDLLAPDAIRNPYPYFGALRDTQPVCNVAVAAGNGAGRNERLNLELPQRKRLGIAWHGTIWMAHNRPALPQIQRRLNPVA